MRKIDKSSSQIIAKKYKNWVDKLEANKAKHSAGNRYYYDDIVMNLYQCQKGVCAYTETFICPEELYTVERWNKNRYTIVDNAAFKRVDHFGEMDHFDPSLKEKQYWLWSNLFMIHAKVNTIKLNRKPIGYLKPDLESYSPEKYFEYDEVTNRYIANTDIQNEETRNEIQKMIDEVFCLNHGVVRLDRRDYINIIRQKILTGEEIKIDRFFTAIKWVLKI